MSLIMYIIDVYWEREGVKYFKYYLLNEVCKDDKERTMMHVKPRSF